MAHPLSDSQTRAAAFAGRWYPGSARDLGAVVDRCLAPAEPPAGSVAGLVCPHAGIIYSGPVAGHGYAAARHSRTGYDVVVLIGPSHYVSFQGVAAAAPGTFDTPLGPLQVHGSLVTELARERTLVVIEPDIHAREHSLEMQLPFLVRVLPQVPIVPLLMGRQDRPTVEALAALLARVLAGTRALVVASSDLSHYLDRQTASRIDRVVLDRLDAFDADGLMSDLEGNPHHACGGGPIVVAMRVARALGATTGRVLHYGDSGDVSGDTSEVVGYVSAAFGRFDGARAH